MGIFREFERGEHKRNRSHLEDLIAVAMADGQISEEENEYLQQLAAEYSITEEELDQMLKHPENYVFHPLVTKDGRLRQIKEIVRMLLADKIITSNEINFCRKFAVSMHYNPVTIVRLTNYLQSISGKKFDLYKVLDEVEEIVENQ